ncbi:MAG: shikimate dehydrogenase [Desulfobacterales bacterium]|nr:MAG: shikimate dehydrogenase [Desulfobacterales bacterium]
MAVIGHPVAHSLSPLMHGAALKAKGINGACLAFDVTDPGGAIHGMRALGITGFSVTIPHKEAVIPYLDELDPDAEAIGAVNTIINRNRKLTGYNTDAFGARTALEEKTVIRGKRTAVIGAGGAARAILHAVIQAGGEAAVVNRTRERGERLAAEMGAVFLSGEELAAFSPEILINTTSVGMTPRIDESPVPASVFRTGMTVMEIIYTPPSTRLLKEARQKGARGINGLSMFVYQGARQFELFTGSTAPVETMRCAVHNFYTTC